jgi:hypothetical protein
MDPQINQLQSQVITATTNEPGKGILLVLQPAEGDPWAGFLAAHPNLAEIWNSLPSDIKTQVQEKIGDKIVSYRIISTDVGGDIGPVTFPNDFTGVNGEPSTALVGIYKVIFVFLSKGESNDNVPLTDNIQCHQPPRCRLCELDFACASWFVVPEVPFGTIAMIVSSITALSVFKLYKRKRD